MHRLKKTDFRNKIFVTPYFYRFSNKVKNIDFKEFQKKRKTKIKRKHVHSYYCNYRLREIL